ncbi:MAG: AAA family ATPase [Planctomycetaceae bacterium]|jgi:AAA15 family ATPase/GTPase|nr:AAA family ATPase [Planctomycetaceae bacterium]
MSSGSHGITQLSVSGFKSIAKPITLDIKPLTLLAGANSSGKSSFMQPLLLLKQTVESSSNPGALLLDGPNVRFTSFEQLQTKLNTDQKDFCISVKFISPDGKPQSVTLKFAKNKKRNRIEVACRCPHPFQYWISSDMGKDESFFFAALQLPEFRHLPEIQEWISKSKKKRKYAPTAEKLQFFRNLANQKIPNFQQHEKTWRIEEERCLVRIVNIPNNQHFVSVPIEAEIFFPVLEQVIHIPGLRGNPERNYKAARVGQRFIGTFEPYTASIIADWVESNSEKLKQISRQAKSLGLTSGITAKRLNDTQIEVKVGRLPENGHNKMDTVSIADIGFGVSQTLPVLTALLAAEPGQLVYIEQPEIHLHPKAQKLLANVLVEAANRGVRVVAETHSSLLLRGVQTLIAKGRIKHEAVALHWFERDKTGKTKVVTAEIDENAAFGEFPLDFADVEMEAAMEYINTVTKKSLESLE